MFFNLGGTDTSSGVAMTQAHASSQLMRAKHDQLTLIDLYNNCNFDQEAYYEDGRIRFRDKPSFLLSWFAFSIYTSHYSCLKVCCLFHLILFIRAVNSTIFYTVPRS